MEKTAAIVYREQYIRCGKARCKKCSGEVTTGHGPYWYAFWSEGGRTRSKYIGKQRPGAEATPAAPARSAHVEQLLAILTPERQRVQDIYRQLSWTRKQLEERAEAEQSILGDLGVRFHVATHKTAAGRREGYITINEMRRSHISRDTPTAPAS